MRLPPRVDAWLLAPKTKLPAARWIRTSLRTVHIAAVCALYGGQLYGVEPERLAPSVLAVGLSGGIFALFEAWQAPIWLVQIRGVATMAKVGLLVAISVIGGFEIPLLTLALVIGSVSSHMPGRWRYHSLVHHRVVSPGEKG